MVVGRRERSSKGQGRESGGINEGEGEGGGGGADG